MGPNLRRFTLWTASLLLAAAVVYGGAWVLVARQVESLSHQWIEAQRQQGWTISHAPLQVGGFPGWPRVEIEEVQVAAPLTDGGWVWAAERATVVPAAIDLSQFSIFTPGRQTLRAPGQIEGLWTLTAFSARTEIGLDDRGRLRTGDLNLGDLEVLDPDGLPMFGAARFHLALGLTDFASGIDGPFARFSAAADAVLLAVDTRPFSRSIPSLRLDVDLVGEIVPGRLSEALNDWRANGGTLEVRRFLFDWPPLKVAGDGTLALDQSLQPIAAFSTRISGFGETLDALVAGGQMSSDDAQGAMLVLNLLAQRPATGAAPEISVPMSVQDRRLSVGPFDVMDVPAISWD